MSNHEVPSSKLAVYATLCEVVYQPNIAADAEARSLGFHTIRHVGNGGPHAMICEDDHRIVVVVRGTERDDVRDLIADGRVLPRRATAGGWVHRGIEDHASQLWTVLQYVEGTSKELWFCGHSLGGAAATHLALAAGSRRIELPHLLTVGAPRVGTRGFCRAVVKHSASITRLVNHRDPVPLCVPGYRHPAAVVFHCDRHSNWIRNPSLRYRFQDRARGWLKAIAVGIRAALGHVFPLQNHAISTYNKLWNRGVM